MDKLNVSKTVATKLFNELNKLNLKKYSFWNLVNIDYVVLQISYYLFAKLIDDNYEFYVKDVTKDNIGIMYNVNFDFDEAQINQFKTNFFCKKDGTFINIELEEDKNIHEVLNIKLAKKIESIISNLDLSTMIPAIIESLQNKLIEDENEKNNTLNDII